MTTTATTPGALTAQGCRNTVNLGSRERPCLTLHFLLPRHSMSLRLSSTKNVLMTMWSCTMGPTSWPPSWAASVAARSLTQWWRLAAAYSSGFTRMPLCRGEVSRHSTAQVGGQGKKPVYFAHLGIWARIQHEPYHGTCRSVSHPQ